MNKNIIAVTADLKRCSVAIRYEGEIFEKNENADAATHLVSIVCDLIREKKIVLEKLSEVVTASGPGSFTGIRVAHSFVKGFSTALKIPAKSTSYFDIILNMALRQSDGTTDFKNSLVLIKNEKGQFYYCLSTEGKSSYGVTNQDNVVHLIKDFPSQSLHLIGDEDSLCSTTSLIPTISEISEKISSRHIIQNFKFASNLINLYENMNFSNSVQPLYINVR